MGMILAVVAPVMFTALTFIVSVSAGAARDLDDVAPINPVAAMLAAMLLFVLQAVLWVRLGVKIWGA